MKGGERSFSFVCASQLRDNLIVQAANALATVVFAFFNQPAKLNHEIVFHDPLSQVRNDLWTNPPT